MKPRTLLILLALVAGLGAFIWFYERDLPGSEERAQLAGRLLRGLEAGDVTALVVESDGESVRLERVPEPAAEPGGDGADGEDGDGETAAAEPAAGELDSEPAWRIAAPAALAGARADRFAVEGLIESLVALERSRTMTGEEADRAAAGLEPPRARVTVVREGEDDVTVEIGAGVPASANVLAALAGEPEVYVVGGGVAGELERAPGDWRDREVFGAGREEVERLTLAPAPLEPTGGERVVLTRRGEDEYWLEEPVADRADTSSVEQLLTDLTTLRADRFADGDPAELGLAEPRGTIEAALAGGEVFRLEIGAPTDGGWYGRAGGQIFEASGVLPETLARDPAGWQSRTLSARRLYQIDRLTIQAQGAPPLELEREGADWRRGGDAIAYTPVSDLLYAITDARAERLAPVEVARAAGHLGEPELTLTLTGGDGDDGDDSGGEDGGAPPSETIALHPPTAEGEVPATVTGRDWVLYLAPAAARTLRESLERLREAEPLPEEEPAAAGDPIEIETEEGG